MTLEMLSEFLLWCFLINFGIMLAWFLMFTLARDLIFKVHSRWFRLSEERFDAIHYSWMAFYKLAIFMLNFVPWLALQIMR